MHFIRKKRDLYKDLIFIVNIEGRRVKIKKNKALSTRGLNKPKNNVAAVCVPGSGEGRDNIKFIFTAYSINIGAFSAKIPPTL